MAAAVVMGPPAPKEDPVVWIFFSPDSPDASALFAQARGMNVRPVLLVERYFGRREPPPSLIATVQAAGRDIRVVDEEGLAEAERLSIRELPAVAVTRGGQTHVASGTRVNLKELLQCSK